MNLTAIDNATKNTTKTTGVSPFMELQIEQVYPNTEQPRKNFDEEYIEELALSIKENGLIQPIAVVKNGHKYMIISGECRYKAHLKADLRTIKAHIIQADAQKIDELTLIENIQRDDLTDYEIAKHIGKLWNSGKYQKKQDLATALSKKPTYISKALSVLKLEPSILNKIEQNNINLPLSVLDEISRVNDARYQNMAFIDYCKGTIKRDDIKNYSVNKTVEEDSQNIKGKSFSKKDLKNFKQSDINNEMWEPVEEPTKDSENFTGENLQDDLNIFTTCFKLGHGGKKEYHMSIPQSTHELLESGIKYKIAIAKENPILNDENIIEKMITDFEMAVAQGTRDDNLVVDKDGHLLVRLDNRYEAAMFDALWKNDLLTGDIETQADDIDELNNEIRDLEDEIEKLKQNQSKTPNKSIKNYTSYRTSIDSENENSSIFNCRCGTQLSINSPFFTEQKYKITIEELT